MLPRCSPKGRPKIGPIGGGVLAGRCVEHGCSTRRAGIKGLASLGPYGMALRAALDTVPPGALGQVGSRTEPPAVDLTTDVHGPTSSDLVVSES